MFDYNDAMNFINSFTKRGKPVKDLSRISKLLDALGNPQDSLKFIHIAGTNGKGSVAQMCTEILIGSGYKTATYTSPFIIEYRDRIRINNEFIPKEKLALITEEISRAISKDENRDSYSQFEISTAAALLYFAGEKCDIVVFETGIGGLLDATNVIKSNLVSIITSVSFDHTAILGNTLTLIAQQKAGVIKKKCPCVLSMNNNEEVVKAVAEKAEKMNSQLVIPQQSELKIYDEELTGSDFSYKGKQYHTHMPGRHQIINALSVIEAMEILRREDFCIKDSSISFGIRSAWVCARTEVIHSEPLIMLDGSHNPDGMNALAGVLSTFQDKNVYVLIGMLRDKNIEESVRKIIPYVKEFVCVGSFYNNCESPDKLAEMITRLGKPAVAQHDLETACGDMLAGLHNNDALIVCGSLYLVSKVRNYFVE